MEIREAVPDDNDALKKIQAKCPQGTDLIVSVVNTPDFFSRAKAYELSKVFIAHEGKHILGPSACGLKNAVVGGKVRRVGYGFQAFVAPEYRRMGIISLLHQQHEDYAAQQGAVLFYTLIIEKNTPAMRCIERRGFKLHRSVVMPAIAVYQKMTANSFGNIRSARPGDLVTLADLFNETWKNFELYPPVSSEKLSQFIGRTPGYSLDNILILEKRGEILAALGYLDWRQIMRITVEAMNLKMRMMGLMLKIASIFRPMPRFAKPGDTLKQIMITLIGYKDPKHLSLLLKHLNNQALQGGIEQIFCICERKHSMLKSLRGFIRINTAINLYVKNFQQENLIPERPVFIDGVDM